MDMAYILLKQILIMFFIMLIGVLLYRHKKISMQGTKELGTLLLYIVIPIVIIQSFCVEYTNERMTGLCWSFLLSLCSLILAMLVSYLIFKRKRPLDNFAASFSNAGFIGIPLVQATIGKEAVFYIASYIALLNILQWTYGLFVMTGKKEGIRFTKLMSNPIVIAVIIGMIIFFLQLPIPELIRTMMSSMAGLNTPLAMLISGAYLAQVSFITMFQDKHLLFSSILRLCILPLMTFLLLLCVPFVDSSIRLAILIAASAPVGSNIAIFASLYDADYLYSVKTVCLSTILSIVTLPPLILLAQQFL